MSFTKQTRIFFYQYKTSLEVSPNLKWEFLSETNPIMDWEIKKPAKGEDCHIIYHNYTSDILPFDYLIETGGPYPEVPRNYIFQKYGVHPGFIATEEILKIKMANEDEKINFRM